jgi:hypothetical protein
MTKDARRYYFRGPICALFCSAHWTIGHSQSARVGCSELRLLPLLSSGLRFLLSTLNHTADTMLLQAILTAFSPAAAEEREFSERFKYRIISSSLLAASISPPQSAGLSRSFNVDREFVDLSSSTIESPSERNIPPLLPLNVSPPVVPLSLCCLLSFLSGSLSLALLFATAIYYFHNHVHNSGHSVDCMQPVRVLIL